MAVHDKTETVRWVWMVGTDERSLREWCSLKTMMIYYSLSNKEENTSSNTKIWDEDLVKFL